MSINQEPGEPTRDPGPSNKAAAEPLPRGLVFFPPGTPQAVRRRRVLFVYIVIVAAVALVWPVYSWVAAPRPLILGLPLGLAWVVGWLGVVFGALLWLYRGDRHLGEAEDDG